MEIKTHEANNLKIAEIISDEPVINTIEDGINLLGDLYYQGFDKIVVYEKQLTPEFFNLGTGIAGEILQKFSTYRMPLAIVGDFSQYTKQSVKDFIYESNQSRHIRFVPSLEEALK